jgi:hypothetical protein
MAVEEKSIRSVSALAYASARADEPVPEDLQGLQEVVEKNLPLLLERLKQSDVLAYGRFVKKLRHMISDGNYAATSADIARVEDLAVMKDNPIWPEIVKRIENQGE